MLRQRDSERERQSERKKERERDTKRRLYGHDTAPPDTTERGGCPPRDPNLLTLQTPFRHTGGFQTHRGDNRIRDRPSVLGTTKTKATRRGNV